MANPRGITQIWCQVSQARVGLALVDPRSIPAGSPSMGANEIGLTSTLGAVKLGVSEADTHSRSTSRVDLSFVSAASSPTLALAPRVEAVLSVPFYAAAVPTFTLSITLLMVTAWAL